MTEFDPIERLRNADPARDLQLSPDFVASVLARRDEATALAEEQAPSEMGAATENPPAKDAAHDGAPAPSVDQLAPVSDLAAARARRRRWLRPLASAAAAAVVFGAGGYLAAVSFVSSGSDDSAASVASEEAAADSAAPEAGSGETEAFDTVPESSADRFSLDVAPATGSVIFLGSGFSTTAGSAAGYGFDAAAAQTPQRLRQVADALGLTGEFVESDGAWVLGGTVQGPTLTVDVGTSDLMFYDDTKAPDAQCGTDQDCLAELAANRPSEEDAQKRLSAFLADIGLDPASFEFDSVDPSVLSQYETSVYASMVVDGVLTDLTWTLSLTSAGITWLQGPSADVVKLADYPVVSEQEAFERLTDPNFGAVRVTYPSGYLPEHGDRAAQVPDAPQTGDGVQWDVPTVTVTSQGLGLAVLRQSDGGSRLVPVYRFVAEDGTTYHVLAPADDVLDFGSE